MRIENKANLISICIHLNEIKIGIDEALGCDDVYDTVNYISDVVVPALEKIESSLRNIVGIGELKREEKEETKLTFGN